MLGACNIKTFFGSEFFYFFNNNPQWNFSLEILNLNYKFENFYSIDIHPFLRNVFVQEIGSYAIFPIFFISIMPQSVVWCAIYTEWLVLFHNFRIIGVIAVVLEKKDLLGKSKLFALAQ